MIRLTRAEMMDIAEDICREYHEEHDLRVTVRQVHYQFVGRGLHDFTGHDKDEADRFYRRVGGALTALRMTGRVPFEWVDDSGRDIGRTWTNGPVGEEEASELAGEELRGIPETVMWAGRWHRQPLHLSVWIEKDALAGVVRDTCKRRHVSLFACRGYPSVTSLWEWVTKTHEQMEANPACDQAVILYVGDHDPDGLEIPDAACRRIDEIMELEGTGFPYRLERIALTREQIETYDPPPMPARRTSARFRKYLERTGLTEAWELDALRPDVLQQLILDNIDQHFDEDAWAEVRATVTMARRQLEQAMLEPGWFEQAMEG